MKKLLSLVLVCAMMLTILLLPASAAKYDREDVTYTDSRGNEITIVGGADSCATHVVSFEHGDPWTSHENAMNPDDILGAPDRNDRYETGALTLGRGGVIVLEFSVAICDGEGNDIYVFEVGDQVEATLVEVSDDLVNWVEIGKADGSLSGVDMNSKVPEGALYHYVRLTDLGTYSSTEYAGADIDAVAIINSKAAPFEDVPSDAYYFTPAVWAFDNEITEGSGDMSTFDPNADCTRAQVVTFLWRVKDKPAPTIDETPFVDLDKTAYYYEALLWAYENGVIKGMDDTHFNPTGTVTRAQFVTMIYRLEQSPSSSIANPFVDVQPDAYYYNAVLWAVEQEITKGMDDTHFAPENPCIRGQVVTFLYRTYA